MPNTPTAVALTGGILIGFAVGLPVGALVSGGFTASDLRIERVSEERVTEDDPRWDCTTMGDQVCGPANTQGAWPGRYVHGNLVIPWPSTPTGDLLAPLTFDHTAVFGR